jgi:hypothetical protein
MDLRARLQERLPDLVAAQADTCPEQAVYWFYDQSLKAYSAQSLTRRIVDALESVAPVRNQRFLGIIAAGTGKAFTPEVNAHWDEEVRPIIDALLHSRQFLDLAIKYAHEEPGTPLRMAGRDITALAHGYAALLTLYGR